MLEIVPFWENHAFGEMSIHYKEGTARFSTYRPEIYITEDMESIVFVYYDLREDLVLVTAIGGVQVKNPFWIIGCEKPFVFWDFSGNAYEYLKLGDNYLKAPVIADSEFKLGIGSGVYGRVTTDSLYLTFSSEFRGVPVEAAIPNIVDSYSGYGYVPDYKGVYEIELDV